MRRRTVLRTLLAAPLGAAAPSLFGGLAHADTNTTVNPGVNWGTWEGWGTSLAWWAKAFGDRDDLADIFFTREVVAWQGQSLPGLGLNIARYNAGACTSATIGGEGMRRSPNITSARQIDGYWQDWYSSDTSSASWNWSADANQRNMMGKARHRGVDHIELFSNSPMWWMCKNHNPSGSVDGGDNLQSWNYQQHAVYLAAIARYAHDHWGIDFCSVEPFNEPDGRWWTALGTQEGCHFDIATQRPVINHLRTQLDARDLGRMPVAASDCWGYDDALATWNGLDDTARGNVGRINVHGYQGQGGRRDLLFNAAAAAGRKIWNSEYGDDDASGMSAASNLTLDLRWLHPTAWVYWQVVDGSGWGLIQNVNGTPGPVNPKYFVLAQFTRHIRPGMRIIDGGDVNTVAAHDEANRKLVIVTTNHATAQWVNYDLSRFGRPSANGARVGRWCTNTRGADRYQFHQDTVMRDSGFRSWFESNTVQTFEVPEVCL